VVEQAALQIALVGIVAESEKIEVVRIFGDVPREVGLRRGQRAVEVGNGFPLPVQSPGLDLVNQNVATPSVLNGRFGVPDTVFGSLDAIQDADIVAPRNLCNKLLHNCFIRPGLAERSHVFQISRREALHVGERSLGVRRQAVDHFRAPVFPFLPVEDIAADLPVEQDQFPIDGH